MEQIIKDTCKKIELWLNESKNPVALWSGGKDSTAMLHLIIHKVGHKVPVVQWREPRFRHRYAYSDRLAQEWDLEMYDWAPSGYAITDGFDIDTGKPRFDFVKGYEMAPKKLLLLCLGTEHPKENEPYLCGVEALNRPTGTFNFPWDVAFHGQKSRDVDLIKGQVPLQVDALVQDGFPTQVYPMRHWSDQEIWSYLETESVPNDETRYEKVGEIWGHKKNKSLNSDYYPICFNCINRHEDKTVYCPKTKCQTNNISHRANYIDIQSEMQGFKKTWGANSTVNGVEPVVVTAGVGLCSERTDQTQF